MRVLESVSAALSLTGGAIITSVLVGSSDAQLLYLAVLCCVVVAAYQMVNIYLGYKIHQRIDRSRSDAADEIQAVEEAVGRLNAADTTRVINRPSVVENTTELLERVPRKSKHDHN
jgi:hypothetical protein